MPRRYITPGCMAEAALTARLFASGVLEACVVYVQRARSSDVPPHVSVNRGVGQFVAGVASTAEGRARLLETEGLEDALMWLLEHGGDPVGIAENNTLADPRGMAALNSCTYRLRTESRANSRNSRCGPTATKTARHLVAVQKRHASIQQRRRWRLGARHVDAGDARVS